MYERKKRKKKKERKERKERKKRKKRKERKERKKESLQVILVKNHCFRAVVCNLGYILESPEELLKLLRTRTLNQNLWGWDPVLSSI